MTDLVPADQIEALVGAHRHESEHLGRAASAAQRVYILHSEACRTSTRDLRDCPFSIALDLRAAAPEDWPVDQPLVLRLYDGHLVARRLGVQLRVAAATPAERLVDAVLKARPTYEDEASLHLAIATVLEAAGIEHEHEVRLDARSRIDLLTADGVGVEVKIAGQAAATSRQLLRYAHHEEVRELVLVTTQADHHLIPAELNGKPVHVCWLAGAWL